MADCAAKKTENTENQHKEANCDEVKEAVKKPETTVDEAGDKEEKKR